MEIHENPQFKVNFHGESSILMGIFHVSPCIIYSSILMAINNINMAWVSVIFHGDLGASICFAALCRLPLGFWRHWCLISLYHAKHHRSVDDENLAEAAQHWFVFAETNHKANCREILQCTVCTEGNVHYSQKSNDRQNKQHSKMVSYCCDEPFVRQRRS